MASRRALGKEVEKDGPGQKIMGHSLRESANGPRKDAAALVCYLWQENFFLQNSYR